MGYFTQIAGKSFLYDLGFKYGEDSGPRGERGFTTTVQHGHETLWITIDTIENKMYLYNEYDCGGMLWDDEVYIPNNVLNSAKYEFAKWLDNEIGRIF